MKTYDEVVKEMVRQTFNNYMAGAFDARVTGTHWVEFIYGKCPSHSDLMDSVKKHKFELVDGTY